MPKINNVLDSWGSQFSFCELRGRQREALATHSITIEVDADFDGYILHQPVTEKMIALAIKKEFDIEIYNYATLGWRDRYNNRQPEFPIEIKELGLYTIAVCTFLGEIIDFKVWVVPTIDNNF